MREALFNILGESVAGRVVVDLFAGTGALGLEALSRGAAWAIFVEQNRENVALIGRNLATLRFEDRARVLATDAYRWARGFAAINDEPMVVFIDPPCREYEVRPRKVNQLLRHLVEQLPPDSIVAVESRGTLDEQVLPDVAAWDIRRYGGRKSRSGTWCARVGREPEPSPFDVGGLPS